MSATSIQIDSRYWSPPSDQVLRAVVAVSTSLSFFSLLPSNIVTLSTNGASIGSAPEGLLYVPQLLSNSSCYNTVSQYIPRDVTRLSDFPSQSLTRIAIAPWLNSACTADFLAAASADQVRSFIFYLPDQGYAPVPSANDAAWGMNDGGQWKAHNQYPVYAVTTVVGQSWMNESASYSGNLTVTPNGDQISTVYGAGGTVRLYATVNLSESASLPSLWIFLVVILAVLVSIVGIVSTTMHFVQRRRRAGLRRRVARGDVDLEVIGVKRLMVPREILDRMPVYDYAKIDPSAASAVDNERRLSAIIPKVTGRKGRSEKTKDASPTRTSRVPLNHFDQPTCAICLDDFIPGESKVRELPCQHIFHADCVDQFLIQVSSLCPLCKKSALPDGYCPDVITNAMVRRERILRRAREHAERHPGAQGDMILQHPMLARLRLRPRARDIEMATSPQVPTATTAPETAEIQSATAAQANVPLLNQSTDPTIRATSPRRTGESRRDWARRRAEAMLGPDAAPVNPENERTPSWRKAIRKVFPAMR